MTVRSLLKAGGRTFLGSGDAGYPVTVPRRDHALLINPTDAIADVPIVQVRDALRRAVLFEKFTLSTLVNRGGIDADRAEPLLRALLAQGRAEPMTDDR